MYPLFGTDNILSSRKQPAFGKSREFEITTRQVGDALGLNASGDIEEEEDGNEGFVHGRLPSCRIREKIEQLLSNREEEEASRLHAVPRYDT